MAELPKSNQRELEVFTICMYHPVFPPQIFLIIGPHLRTFSRCLTLSSNPPTFDQSTVTADDPLPLQLSSSEDPTKTSVLRQDPLLLELVDPELSQDPLLELLDPHDPLLELVDPESTWTCC